MATRGRVYLDVDNLRAVERAVRGNTEVRVTYYPTSSYQDEPVTIFLKRVSRGPEQGQVVVSVQASPQGRREVLFEQLIDQPAGAKERT